MLKKKKSGATLIVVVCIICMIIIVGMAMLGLVVMDYRMRVAQSERIKNLYGAESGINVLNDMMMKQYDSASEYGIIKVDQLNGQIDEADKNIDDKQLTDDNGSKKTIDEEDICILGNGDDIAGSGSSRDNPKLLEKDENGGYNNYKDFIENSCGSIFLDIDNSETFSEKTSNKALYVSAKMVYYNAISKYYIKIHNYKIQLEALSDSDEDGRKSIENKINNTESELNIKKAKAESIYNSDIDTLRNAQFKRCFKSLLNSDWALLDKNQSDESENLMLNQLKKYIPSPAEDDDDKKLDTDKLIEKEEGIKKFKRYYVTDIRDIYKNDDGEGKSEDIDYQKALTCVDAGIKNASSDVGFAGPLYLTDKEKDPYITFNIKHLSEDKFLNERQSLSQDDDRYNFYKGINLKDYDDLSKYEDGDDRRNQKFRVEITSKFMTDKDKADRTKTGLNRKIIKAVYDLEIPNYADVKYKETKFEPFEFNAYADSGLTVFGNLNVQGSSFDMTGNMYVYGDRQPLSDPLIDKYRGGAIFDGIKNAKIHGNIYTPSTLCINNSKVKVDQGEDSDETGGNIYAGNVFVGKEDGLEGYDADLSLKDMYLNNDLCLKSDSSNVSLNNFYGLNDKVIKDSADLNNLESTARNSSSIIVNSYRGNSKIHIADESYIMGVSYIDTTSNSEKNYFDSIESRVSFAEKYKKKEYVDAAKGEIDRLRQEMKDNGEQDDKEKNDLLSSYEDRLSKIDISSEESSEAAIEKYDKDSYETGESTGIRGNQSAYSKIFDSEDEDDFKLVYKSPLMLLEKKDGSDLTIDQKDKHFCEYWNDNIKDIENGGIVFDKPSLINSTGAVVYKNSDNTSSVKQGNADILSDSFNTKIKKLKHDFAKHAFNLNAKIADGDSEKGLKFNFDDDPSKFDMAVQSLNISDLSLNDATGKVEDVSWNDKLDSEAVIEGSGYTGIFNQDPDKKIKIKDGKADGRDIKNGAFIVTAGDVDIEDTEFRGCIVCLGDLNIKGDTKIIYDKDVPLALQEESDENAEIFSKMFGTMGSKHRQQSDEGIDVDYDVSRYIKMQVWNIIDPNKYEKEK